VSTATRARETWAELAPVVPAEVQLLDRLYQAGSDELLETVGLLDDDVTVAVVVGHNPTVQATVERLAGSDGPASEELRRTGFPPATAAVLELADGWRELGAGHATLVALHVARG
jgi:phosphohistidine phosphatase